MHLWNEETSLGRIDFCSVRRHVRWRFLNQSTISGDTQFTAIICKTFPTQISPIAINIMHLANHDTSTTSPGQYKSQTMPFISFLSSSRLGTLSPHSILRSSSLMFFVCFVCYRMPFHSICYFQLFVWICSECRVCSFDFIFKSEANKNPIVSVLCCNVSNEWANHCSRIE